MSGEPASTAAGSIAAWKVGASILGVGVVAAAIGFLVLLPKTAKEAAMRALATIAASTLFGPVTAFAAYNQWPSLFAAGEKLAVHMGQPPEAGLAMAGIPFVAMAGLPAWWILGALVRWFEKRKEKDLGELINDGKNVLKGT